MNPWLKMIDGGRAQLVENLESELIRMIVAPDELERESAKQQVLELDRRLSHRGELSPVTPCAGC